MSNYILKSLFLNGFQHFVAAVLLHSQTFIVLLKLKLSARFNLPSYWFLLLKTVFVSFEIIWNYIFSRHWFYFKTFYKLTKCLSMKFSMVLNSVNYTSSSIHSSLFSNMLFSGMQEFQGFFFSFRKSNFFIFQVQELGEFCYLS